MDEFSDDGFDDLNEDYLQELENEAWTSTQVHHHPNGGEQQHQVQDNFEYEDDDLDDTFVFDELAQPPGLAGPHAPGQALQPPLPPAISQHSKQLQAQRQLAPQRQIPQPQSSLLPPAADLRHPQQVPLPPHHSRPPPPTWNQQPPPTPGMGAHPTPQRSQYPIPSHPTRFPPRPALAQASQRLQDGPPPASRSSGAPETGRHPNDFVTALQNRIRALEADLTSAKGEAAVVRNKYEAAQKTHDTELSRLRKQNADQLAKHERAVEAAIAAEKSASTELEFTRQDLKEELDRHRKGKKGENGGLATTPRKNAAYSNWDVADGFDDFEILPSPSKGAGRRNKDAGAVALPVTERTPTKAKRKRPPTDSPGLALEVHSEDLTFASQSNAAATAAAAATLSMQPDSLPFDFLQLVLDHSGFPDRPLTFEVFARYNFPSDPSQSFASLIFQKLPTLGSAHQPWRLLIDFCFLILDIWSRCLDERCHEPIYDVIALFAFVLQLNSTHVAPEIVGRLVPIAQTTIYLVSVEAFNSPDGDLARHPDAAVRQLFLDIDTTGTLSVMYLTALSCSSFMRRQLDSSAHLDHPPQMQFWQLLHLEFVLSLLSPKQAPDDFLGMLILLRTSVLPETIGPITADPNRDPSFVARVLIDRISHYLTDPPKWAVPGSFRQCEVRLLILGTLSQFARSPFGKLKLAEHAQAIPRLVTALCGAIDTLYDMDIPNDLVDVVSSQLPQDSETQESGERDTADTVDTAEIRASEVTMSDDVEAPTEVSTDISPLLYSLISSTVTLLHTLITDPATSSAANVQSKLSSFHGGSQRYLLTLGRLNFAEEDLVMEAGIDAEIVELAHELLELAVTPDEGEGIGEVFGL